MPTQANPRLLDLFSGVGGFSLGFERAGFQTAAFSEIEPFACRVLAHRWPEVPNLGDTTKIKGEELGRIDVVTAGFPCQDVSVAGKRRGLAGSRSGLFWEIVRLAGETRAPWLVLENVPGLLNSNEGRDFAAVLDSLGELGYGLAWRVLDAQNFGVPQRRRRVFVVGCLGAPCPPEILFEPEGLRRDIKEGREEGARIADSLTVGANQYSGFNGEPVEAERPVVIKGAAVGREPEHGPQYGEVLTDGTCYTLNTVETQCVSTLQGGGKRGHQVDAEGAAGGHLPPVAFALRGRKEGTRVEVSGDAASALRGASGGSSKDYVAQTVAASEPIAFHCMQDPISGSNSPCLSQGNQEGISTTAVSVPGMAVRRLTPVECARLQGFPDDFLDIPGASDSARYRALGNAVCVPVVKWLASRLFRITRAEVSG